MVIYKHHTRCGNIFAPIRISSYATEPIPIPNHPTEIPLPPHGLAVFRCSNPAFSIEIIQSPPTYTAGQRLTAPARYGKLRLLTQSSTTHAALHRYPPHRRKPPIHKRTEGNIVSRRPENKLSMKGMKGSYLKTFRSRSTPQKNRKGLRALFHVLHHVRNEPHLHQLRAPIGSLPTTPLPLTAGSHQREWSIPYPTSRSHKIGESAAQSHNRT